MVPIYNVEVFIEKCCRSLFEQTFVDIEYIFVNDCTPDKSISILEKTLEQYPQRKKQVKIIHHKRNTGIAEVRNTCIKNANGIYTLFIDSDDWIEINGVEEMYNKAELENADIVGCDYYLTYKDKEIYSNEKYPSNHLDALKYIISNNSITTLWKLFIKKSVYTNNQIFFDLKINVAEDYIVSVKLYYYSKRIVHLRKAFYHYIKYNEYSYSIPSINNFEDRILAIKSVELFCQEKGITTNVKKELDERKFMMKAKYIMDEQFINLHKFKTLFPESNYAWRLFNFRADYKLIFWLAEYNINFLIIPILNIRKILKNTLIALNSFKEFSRIFFFTKQS